MGFTDHIVKSWNWFSNWKFSSTLSFLVSFEVLHAWCCFHAHRSQNILATHVTHRVNPYHRKILGITCINVSINGPKNNCSKQNSCHPLLRPENFRFCSVFPRYKLELKIARSCVKGCPVFSDPAMFLSSIRRKCSWLYSYTRDWNQIWKD